MRLRLRPRVALGLAAGTCLLVACERGFFAAPAAGPGAGRALLSLNASGVTGGPGAALTRADGVRLQLTPSNEADAPVDTTLSFDGGTTVELGVTLRESTASFALAVDVLYQGQAVFHGNGSVTLTVGETSPATITLTSVPARVAVPASFGPITALGNTLQLTGAVVFATGDTIPGPAVTWTSLDPAIATVTAGGLATARAEGEARVRATYQTMTADSRVTVSAVVRSVAVAPTQLQLLAGNAAQLSATARDANGNLLVRNFTWASDDSTVAVVNASTGLVTGRRAGNTNIRASAGGQTSAPVPVQVVTVRVASVAVQPSSADLVVGQALQLQAITQDSAGNVLAGRSIAWTSSNDSVATVSASGLVTGRGTGAVRITATSEGQAGSASITVGRPLIVLSDSAIAFGAVVGQNAAPRAVTVTNGGTGTLSGLAASVAYSGSPPSQWLTATLGSATAAPSTQLTLQPASSSLPAGTYQATVTVSSSLAGVAAPTIAVTLTVSQVAIARLSIQPNNLSLQSGQSAPVTATPKDSAGNTLTNQTITWLVRKPGVATVSPASGSPVSVSGVGAGNTWVVASAAGVSDSAQVSVCVATIVAFPGSASFTGTVGFDPVPNPQGITIANGGCGTLSGLSASVSYTSGPAAGWLQAQVSGTSLTLTAASAALPLGGYGAVVIVSSSLPGMTPDSIPVTLTVGDAPTITRIPTPVDYQLFSSACQDPEMTEFFFQVYYNSAHGFGSASIKATFNPSGIVQTPPVDVTPGQGVVQVNVCYFFSSDNSVTNLITVTDTLGNVSKGASVTVARPVGAASKPLAPSSGVAPSR